MARRAKQPQISGNGEPAELLDYDEAAAYLNMSRHWVVRHKGNGDLPFIKLGRRVLFWREDLDAYLAENYHPAADR